ncbi:hypothetical protein B6N60_01045 [Richelia sinica FACHB-800]|uniref:Uncharacterized protein n=1 Tax=Richelia sinica FACHB-800 TaxID=1357546 RepID=A0A975Y3Q9_9NOST|nr:hypothetical protein [Richelia sinica]MBD2664887.1 hypothetical protein [Richelia sinica FACHB-800]QXE22362.1 hypothetical protein B6N60_01045 [Richelia sinica FACHB-800]
MYYRNWQIILFLITPFIAIGILLLPIIPNLTTAQFVISVVIWLLMFICGFLIFKKPQSLPIIKTRILIIIYLLVSSLVFLFVAFLVIMSADFDAPTIETLKYQEYPTTAYLYNYTCFPPDSATECDTYRGELKLKIGITPFVETKFICPCLFGTPERVDEWVILPLEANRDKKLSSIKINLKTSEIIKQ